MSLKLRSELVDYERLTYSEWQAAQKAVAKNAEKEVITALGNQHRFELLDGGQNAEEYPEKGYFENDRECIKFILKWVKDPTWETLIWAASMHCGGTYDEDVFEEVVSEAEGEF
jgi:hypothetical protein